ncbi:hypothetical protein F4778DRAFT_746554 [Xylariomycetidae sp. FL2044]|nr:hypothetical protein F4778DRAFT_746554 [Xylariomycetidae sp. FL2044]
MRRKYRIEVTYGVYVYTPGEKLVFWALFLSLFVLISGALAQYVLWHIAAPLARWVVTGSCRHLFGGGGGVRDGAGAAGVAGMRMRMGRGTEMGGRAAVRSQGA